VPDSVPGFHLKCGNCKKTQPLLFDQVKMWIVAKFTRGAWYYVPCERSECTGQGIMYATVGPHVTHITPEATQSS